MSGKTPRAPRGKTVSFDNLEALFSKKALEAYIVKIEEQKDWPEGNLFTRDEVLTKLESVVEKIDSLPYFSPTKAMQAVSSNAEALGGAAELG
jgi:hypothetical protein